uniref:Aegyptin/gSG7 salivary protein-like four-helix bundle domain-containing protein n=1 Tax=Anopheles farauti TaxID=69004 RepID=A0A182QY53_9DIPT
MKSTIAFWVIGAVGLICMMQLTETDATLWHGKQVMQYFQRVRQDKTKNRVYLLDVKRGVRLNLRGPLFQNALCLPHGTKLSSDCLNRMVDKARQHENKFYAKFTYACKGHAEYSSACLEKARPEYYRDLKNLAKETIQCLKVK